MARACFIGGHSTGGFEKTGIALGNRAALTAQLREATATLTELLEILSKPDEDALRRFLAEAKALRDTVQV